MKHTHGEKQHAMNLRKTAELVMIIGFAAFLTLMVIGDFGLVSSYQRGIISNEKGQIGSVTGAISDAMNNISKELISITWNDTDYRMLSRSEGELSEYVYAYNVKNTFEDEIIYGQSTMHGAYVFYHNYERSQVTIDPSMIKARDTLELRNTLKSMLKQGSMPEDWIAMTVENDTYLVRAFQNTGTMGTAICALYSLNRLQAGLEDALSKEISLGLQMTGLTTEEELWEAVPEGTGKGQSFVRGRMRYYLEEVPEAGLQILVSYRMNFVDYLKVWHLVLILLTILSCLGIIQLYTAIKRQIVNPLEALHTIKNTREKDQVKKAADQTRDSMFAEIRDVGSAVEDMAETIEKEQISREQVQMQYLQLQLKPHFYLNGLKTLYMLAEQNRQDREQELILELSKHLRYVFQSEAELTNLRAELDFVSNYVEMQKTISGRKVALTAEIAENVYDWQIPYLSVFTFVENSIKYAKLGSMDSVLEIGIRADPLQTEDSRCLDLVVRDNGQGYAEDILEDINSAVIQPGKQNIGINNIRRRCRILYGMAAEFNFYNDEGAVSELIIPENSR